MSVKTKLKKIIQHPSVMFEKNRGLAMARYDLLVARDLHPIPFKTFVDVGSASGEYTVMFKDMFYNPNIISFEPIPDLHPQLKGHKPIRTVLWNENCTLTFNICDDPRGSSLVHKYPNQTKQVRARRFDTLDKNIIEPALLKIDVEGAEKEVLQGFGKRLKEFSVVILEINMNENGRVSEIFEIMEQHGFYKFVQEDLRGGLEQCNIFFVMGGDDGNKK